MTAVLVASNALKTFSACSTALALKMFVTLTIQGGKTFEAGARPPEDNKFNRDGMPPQNYGLAGAESGEQMSQAVLKAREIDFRWKRIVQNDLENIPVGLLVMLGSVLAGGHETTNVVLMAAFTAARIGHTVAYAHELQPHRAILWTIGQLCVLACGLNGVISFIIGDKRAKAAAAAVDSRVAGDLELQEEKDEEDEAASLTRRRGTSKRKH